MYKRFLMLLIEKDLRPADVARATGILPQTLSNWKQGNGIPKIDKLTKIADFLGVSVAYLMGETDDKTRNINHPVPVDIPSDVAEMIGLFSNLPKEWREEYLRQIRNTTSLLRLYKDRR